MSNSNILAILIIVSYFVNKRMNQSHELKIIKSLNKIKPKKILAITKYKKAFKQKIDENTTKLIDYIHMLFTLF